MTIIYNLSSPMLATLRNRIDNSDTITFGKTTMTLEAFFSQRPKGMLSLDVYEKVIKGNAKGYRTAILYLTASNASGETQLARLRKTLFLHQYRDEALAMLSNEIDNFYNASVRGGWTLLVRLNGTSGDIQWENEGNLIQSRPHVQFYDYTDIPNREGVPANYDLTYNYTGVKPFLKFIPLVVANPNLLLHYTLNGK
jgi:hypothetical protein